MDQVMMVAAEASSSLFALRLMEYWKRTGKQIHCFGVGSDDMEALGFERLGKSEEMAVVGAAEIIEHYGHLKSVFNKLVEEAKKRRPKVVVVMDYPEFNLMLSKKMHELGIKVVYYVSPQVWAWRKGRVLTIQKYCEKVLLLFPFEVAFYDSKGVKNEFVGHPVLDELSDDLLNPEHLRKERGRRGIAEKDIVIGIMPGSRRGELKQHFQIQLQAVKKIYKQYPNIRPLIIVAPTLSKEQLQEAMDDFDIPHMMIKDDPFRTIALADYVLVASGTATLMVGLLQKPMVIMYKMKFLTGIFAKIFIRGIKYFGLVNLILDREVVPELFQSEVNPDRIAAELKKYLDDPVHTAAIKAELAKVRAYLGDKGATERVARSLEEYLR